MLQYAVIMVWKDGSKDCEDFFHLVSAKKWYADMANHEDIVAIELRGPNWEVIPV